MEKFIKRMVKLIKSMVKLVKSMVKLVKNMMKLGSNMMKLVKSTNGFKRIQIYDETSSIFYPPRSTSHFHAPRSLNKQLHTTSNLLTYIFSFLYLLIFTKAYVVLS